MVKGWQVGSREQLTQDPKNLINGQRVCDIGDVRDIEVEETVHVEDVSVIGGSKSFMRSLRIGGKI